MNMELEERAVCLAWGVYLMARDLMLSGIAEGRWFSTDGHAPNLGAIDWGGIQGHPPDRFEFAPFFERNRAEFLRIVGDGSDRLGLATVCAENKALPEALSPKADQPALASNLKEFVALTRPSQQWHQFALGLERVGKEKQNLQIEVAYSILSVSLEAAKVAKKLGHEEKEVFARLTSVIGDEKE
jgi:hypothetical protein